MRRGLAGVAVAVHLAWAVAGEAAPPRWRFTRIADTETPIPGGAGSFRGFNWPSFDGVNVAFQGHGFTPGDGVQEGIYTDAGGLSVIADLRTPVPGAPGITFADFDTSPSIDAGNVVFWACGSSGTTCGSTPEAMGTYADIGGLRVVADTGTPLPGGTGPFVGFGHSAIHGDQVVFTGFDADSRWGVYRGGPGLEVVADSETGIPGGSGNFRSFSWSAIEGENVAFDALAPGGQGGIYLSTPDGLAVVADRNTPIPGGTGTFSTLAWGSLDGEDVAFWGCGTCGVSSDEGVYTSVDGLGVVADTRTPIPGGVGSFDILGGPSLDEGRVAFPGWSAEGEGGVYTDLAGFLEKVLVANDVLDGWTVSSASVSPEGLRGTSLALRVSFDGGRHAIYRADLIVPVVDVRGAPDPATAGAPFTLSWSLKNPGPEARVVAVLAFVTTRGAIVLGLGPLRIPAGLVVDDAPIATFAYPPLPTSAWVVALLDHETFDLISLGVDVIALDARAGVDERTALRRDAAAFARRLARSRPSLR